MTRRTRILVRNGLVVDGTGRQPEYRDVLVDGDTIAETGAVDPSDDMLLVDAGGMVVAPGFIDIHSHSDFTLIRDPRALSQIRQGVTTEVVGNCGYGCCPICSPVLACEAIYGYDKSVVLDWKDLDGYFARLDSVVPAVNVASLVPNGQLRLGVLGMARRPATTEEVLRMERLLQSNLEQGAIGFSTGLEYPWEAGASAEEVTALCRVAARSGGLYATHTRDRDGKAIEAIDEAVDTARRASVRLQISHIVPRRGRSDTERAIERVDEAVFSGADVAFDMHTRLFGTTFLKVILPPEALGYGRDELYETLGNPDRRAPWLRYRSLVTAIEDWSRVELFSAPACPQFERMSLSAIGDAMGVDPHTAAFHVLRHHLDDLNGPMVLLHTYDEDTLRLAYRHSLCTIGSDATALCPDGPLAGSRFHGAYTWVSWFFRRMVRESATFTLQAAVHKLTGQAADRAGLRRRGLLRKGYRADIVAFDPESFGETATVYHPNRLAAGVCHLLVNGVPSILNGQETGLRSGRTLRFGEG